METNVLSTIDSADIDRLQRRGLFAAIGGVAVGGLGAFLLDRGLRYRGVDAEPAMVDAARRRLGELARVEEGDLNDYAPPASVAAASRSACRSPGLSSTAPSRLRSTKAATFSAKARHDRAKSSRSSSPRDSPASTRRCSI